MDGFVYIPQILTKYGWWNQVSMARDWIPVGSRLNNLIGMLGIILALWGAWRLYKLNLGLGAAAAILWFGFLAALSYGHWGDIWHMGLAVLGTLALLALGSTIQGRKLSLNAPTKIILYFLLMLSTLAGFGAVYSDGIHVFGQGTNVVKWLEANAPNETPIFYPAAWGQVYAALTGRPYYVLEGEKEIFAMRSDTSLTKPVSPLLVDKLELPPEGRIVVTGWYPFSVRNAEGEFWVEPLASFYPSMEFTESFWIYRVRPESSNEENHSTTWKTIFCPYPTYILGPMPGVWEQNGSVIIRTSGAQAQRFTWTDQAINSSGGTTAEVRLRMIRGPTAGTHGMICSVQDGKREGKISFFDNHIEVLDQSEVKAVYWMDTRDDFHTYRLAMVGDKLEVYVDGDWVTRITLAHDYRVETGNINLGDFSTETGQNTWVDIEYLAYSPEGVFAPW